MAATQCRFRCLSCRRPIQTGLDLRGKPVRCPKCRLIQVVPGELVSPFAFAQTDTPVDLVTDTPYSVRKQRRLWVIGVAILVLTVSGLVGIAGGAYLVLFTGAGPWAGPPGTCKELVELLQARGMSDLRWERGEYGGTTIIVLKDHPEGYSPYRATIRQCSSLQEARELAGARPEAFYWGRFCVSGHTELVKEIKGRLGV